MMVLVSRDFGRYFMKEDPERSSAPSPGEDTSEQATDMKQEVILLVY